MATLNVNEAKSTFANAPEAISHQVKSALPEGMGGYADGLSGFGKAIVDIARAVLGWTLVTAGFGVWIGIAALSVGLSPFTFGISALIGLAFLWTTYPIMAAYAAMCNAIIPDGNISMSKS